MCERLTWRFKEIRAAGKVQKTSPEALMLRY